MTIKHKQGDLLSELDVDAIVSTVNCVGVMGKGIALQFKKKWPENFKGYQKACRAGAVRLGQMHVHSLGNMASPRFIINFPTKGHWRSGSHLADIASGLENLVQVIRQQNIRSIALPTLGCGNGGLAWRDVEPLIERAFADLPDVEVRLFTPDNQPKAREIPINTAQPKMTASRAAILTALALYRGFDRGRSLSKIKVQKLAYFLQAAGEDLKLNFVKHQYGPYSDRLRHALDTTDGHFIHGAGDGVVEAEIAPDDLALKEARHYLSALDSSTNRHIQQVADLIDGFQSPYGMELLATVHWVAIQEGSTTADEATAKIQQWNDHKKDLMKPHHIQTAWRQLEKLGWI